MYYLCIEYILKKATKRLFFPYKRNYFYRMYKNARMLCLQWVDLAGKNNDVFHVLNPDDLTLSIPTTGLTSLCHKVVFHLPHLRAFLCLVCEALCLSQITESVCFCVIIKRRPFGVEAKFSRLHLRKERVVS